MKPLDLRLLFYEAHIHAHRVPVQPEATVWKKAHLRKYDSTEKWPLWNSSIIYPRVLLFLAFGENELFRWKHYSSILPKYHITYGQTIFKGATEYCISITWQMGMGKWIFLLRLFLKSNLLEVMYFPSTSSVPGLLYVQEQESHRVAEQRGWGLQWPCRLVMGHLWFYTRLYRSNWLTGKDAKWRHTCKPWRHTAAPDIINRERSSNVVPEAEARTLSQCLLSGP